MRESFGWGARGGCPSEGCSKHLLPTHSYATHEKSYWLCLQNAFTLPCFSAPSAGPPPFSLLRSSHLTCQAHSCLRVCYCSAFLEHSLYLALGLCSKVTFSVRSFSSHTTNTLTVHLLSLSLFTIACVDHALFFSSCLC